MWIMGIHAGIMGFADFDKSRGVRGDFWYSIRGIGIIYRLFFAGGFAFVYRGVFGFTRFFGDKNLDAGDFLGGYIGGFFRLCLWQESRPHAF